MRRLLYGIKSFKYDLLSSAGAIITPIVAYYFGYDEKIITTISVVFFLLIVIHLRLKDRDFYFIPLTKPKDKDDWIGAGIFEYSRTDNCFKITNAESGYIYSKCLIWSDYRFEFDFKIVRSCLGVIVRATNLSNYAMLQIDQDGIRPHVRINGWWHDWKSMDVGLTFSNANEISLDQWYKCRIACDKRSTGIQIYNAQKEKIFDRQWELPAGSVIFSSPEGKKGEDDNESTFSPPVSGGQACQQEKDALKAAPLQIPFPINLEYGSVGFRNWGTEQALVKNALIEKI